MALLTVEEIRKGLDQEFIPLEPMVTGLRLINGGGVQRMCWVFLKMKIKFLFRMILDV